jgi:hypothetical protein
MLPDACVRRLELACPTFPDARGRRSRFACPTLWTCEFNVPDCVSDASGPRVQRSGLLSSTFSDPACPTLTTRVSNVLDLGVQRSGPPCLTLAICVFDALGLRVQPSAPACAASTRVSNFLAHALVAGVRVFGGAAFGHLEL